jgi:hypothetical protein
MPKKPTNPFAYISFAKDGKTEKHVAVLSSIKDTQERQVADSFIAAYNATNPDTPLTFLKQLPENDHDFLLRDAEQRKIVLQLTELVDRAYMFPMSREEYDKGQWREAVLRESGKIPWRVDTAKRDAALYEQIRRKQARRYARETKSDLWLLVFTTDELYHIESYSLGTRQISSALRLARDGLSASSAEPFMQIWFSNLLAAPTRVWPTT